MRIHIAVLITFLVYSIPVINAAGAEAITEAPVRPLLFGYLEVVDHSYDFKKGGDRVGDILFEFFGGAQILRLWQSGKYKGGKRNRSPDQQLVELTEPVEVNGLTLFNSGAPKTPRVRIKKLKTLPGYLFYTVDAFAGNWELREIARGGSKGAPFCRIESNNEYEDFIKLSFGDSTIDLGSRVVLTVPTSTLSFAGAYRISLSCDLQVTDREAATFQRTAYTVEKIDEPLERTLLAELAAIRDLRARKDEIQGRITDLGK